MHDVLTSIVRNQYGKLAGSTAIAHVPFDVILSASQPSDSENT